MVTGTKEKSTLVDINDMILGLTSIDEEVAAKLWNDENINHDSTIAVVANGQVLKAIMRGKKLEIFGIETDYVDKYKTIPDDQLHLVDSKAYKPPVADQASGVTLQIQSESGPSSKQAFVKVFLDGKLVAQVKGRNDQEGGADGYLYQVIKLEQVPLTENIERLP